jgi:hypothetical protein
MGLETLVSAFLELFKQTPKVFFALALVGFLVLFLPNSVVETIGLLEFREQYKGYIGIITLICSSLLLGHVGSIAYKQIVLRISFWRTMRDLSLEEKIALKPYISNDDATRSFIIGDGIANGLTAKKILYRASNVGTYGNRFAFNLQPWARRYLRRRKKFFKDVPDSRD